MFNKYRSVVEARKSLVSDVESSFLPAEASAIQAATQIAACLMAVMERHAAARLKPLTAVAAIDRLAEAASMAVALRAKMMAVHGDLVAAAVETGFIDEVIPWCEDNTASLAASDDARASVDSSIVAVG